MNNQNRTTPVNCFVTPSTSNAISLLESSLNSVTNLPCIPNPSQNVLNVPVTQPCSVINLSHSSEVVIGSKTQYQGSVTIYQYMDATEESRTIHSNEGIHQNKTTQNTTTLIQKLSTNNYVLTGLVLIIVVSVVWIIYFNFQHHDNKKDVAIFFGNNYETGSFFNLGNGHLVIEREQWGGKEENRDQQLFYALEHPIPYVLIAHVTVQIANPPDPCVNIYRCSIKMRTYQDAATAEHLPDIASNFYVGYDGNVYVGRGWDVANTYMNKTLAITFMGDYMRNKPHKKQLEAVLFLLDYGVANKFLSLDYKLVAQNQTQITRSPGIHVYSEIIKWPHWYPCGMANNSKCGSEIGLPEVWDAKQ